MSRCFPFPPPGYERKEKAEDLDLITKVKHQVKKAKKEKRDREKKERRDKKKKDRNKDKHKDKKERKEKHKDRKKEKDKDKAKSSRVAETDEQNHNHLDDKLVDRQTNHFKLTEELVNRIRDDENVATSRMVESSNGSVKSRSPQSATAITIAQSVAGNNGHRCSSDYSRKGINEMETGAKFNCFAKKVEDLGSTKLLHSDSGSVYEYAQKHNITGETGTKGMSLSMDTSMGVAKELEVSKSSITDGSKKIKTNRISSDSSFKLQKTINGMHKPKEILPNMVHQDVKSTQNLPNMVGQDVSIVHTTKTAYGEVIKHLHVMTDDRMHGGNSKVGNNAEKKIQGKEKDKKMGSVNGKEEAKKNQDDKHKKKKDQHKHKEKGSKEADKSEKSDGWHKNHHSTDDAKGKWIASSSVKSPSLQTDNGNSNSTEENIKLEPFPSSTVENIKKRKKYGASGLSHENYGWPNKLPRTSSFPHIVENGSRLQLENSALPCSTKAETSNSIIEVKILVDKKGHMKNGITQAVDSKHPVGLGNRADKSTSRTSHSDTKYLDKIYKVPQMDEWPECDEQDWLFNNHRNMAVPPGPNTKVKVGEIPEVWSRALRIESDDTVILPYVVPF